MHYEFTQPSGQPHGPSDVSLLCAYRRIGLSGGIVKLPEECSRSEQANGIGFTVYYYVASIEEVHVSMRSC